jgi:hypothetical protein
VASLSEAEVKAIGTALAGKDGFGGVIAKVLALRLQVVSGTNRHVIFTDPQGGLFAAVLYTNARQEVKVTYYAKIPAE